MRACIGGMYELGEGERVAGYGTGNIVLGERGKGEGWIRKLKELKEERGEEGIKEKVNN